MTRLPVERLPDTAANEDFTGKFKRPEALAHEGGWDPREVWRTRVKPPAVAKREAKTPAVDPALK